MKKGFTLIELLVALAIMGILMGISITVYVGVTENASRSAVKQNFNAVVKWIKADAALCKMNGSSSTVFRQTNSSGGGQERECGNVTDYNKTPFHENVLQTHIGYIGVAGKNPYGSVGTDRDCDIWKGWTDMTSIQSAHLGKKMCNGQIGLYSETVEQNGCNREMIVQAGLAKDYWTFSNSGSDDVLSTKICVVHK